MAARQTAHRSIHALRQTIEKIEGSANRFSSPAVTDRGVSPVMKMAADDRKRTTSKEPASNPATQKQIDCVPLGVSRLDAAMGGGFPLAGLGEIRCEQTRDWGTVCAFALMVIARLRHNQPQLRAPLVWIADPAARREGGDIWMPGWRDIATDTHDDAKATNTSDTPELLVIRPRTTLEALWAAETAAASPAAGAVIAEIRGNPVCLGLTESRRLHFRARESLRPLLLLRQSAIPEASAAPLRFLVGPAPAGLRQLAQDVTLPGSLGAPALSVTLEKSRQPSPLSLILEWSAHECRFVARPGQSGSSRPPATADHGPVFSHIIDRPDHPQTPGTWLALDTNQRAG